MMPYHKTTDGKAMKLEDRPHLKIGTFHYPPYIIINHELGAVYGIEPSILQILAEQLNFTFEYVFASPNEMWGAFTDLGGNVTSTGLLGMIHRNEVDLALGDLYLDYNEHKYIDFTQPYGSSHECFVVPVPNPYPKWTALYEPFQWPIWIALILCFIFVALTLRLAAKLRNVAPTYNDVYLCVLFVLGHILGIHQSHQGIRSTANRFLFIIWLLCTLVIATSYRTVLTSYMTSPYTPPPVDTIQQLTESPLGKITFGNFIRDSLLRSNTPSLKELGRQIIVSCNFTYMISLMESGEWAVQSSKETLEYMAAGKYQEVGNRNHRVHLMTECVLPAMSALGLPKNSLLKPYFDLEIQKLVEAGLTEHHRSKFARRLPENNLSPSNDVRKVIKAISLEDLQGAFYFLLFGLIASFLCFFLERLIYRLKSK